jgi:hypothetical protein
VKAFVEGVAGGLEAHVRVGGDAQPPIGLLLHAAGRHLEIITGAELTHAREDRARIRDAQQVKKFPERGRVDLGRELRIGKERLHLGGEQEAPTVGDVIERLNANPVARDDEELLAPVPERECEHAVNVVEKSLAPHLIEPQDHLGVRGRAKAAALSLQVRLQLGIVIALAVIDDPY